MFVILFLDSLIVNTLSPKLLSRVTSASILVEKLAFDPDMSHYATCVLSSISGRRQVDVSIVLYAHQITPAPQGNWNVTITDSRQILQVFHNGGRTNELMYPVKTPIIVDLYFERDGYPEILWIGFEGGFMNAYRESLSLQEDKSERYFTNLK